MVFRSEYSCSIFKFTLVFGSAFAFVDFYSSGLWVSCEDASVKHLSFLIETPTKLVSLLIQRSINFSQYLFRLNFLWIVKIYLTDRANNSFSILCNPGK